MKKANDSDRENNKEDILQAFKGTTAFYRQYDSMRIYYMRLFLYVKEDALEDIIKNQRLRISCPARTNDATEGVPQKESFQRETIRQYGYICLSAIHNSPAMWGYYAECCKGACLVFDFPVHIHNKNQFRILQNGIDKQGTLAPWLQRIKYSKYRAIKEIDNYGFKEPNFDVLTTKSRDWQHEKEFRVFYRLSEIETSNIEIIEEKKSSHIIYYDTSLIQNITAIILGVNYPGTISDVEAKLKIAKYKSQHDNSCSHSLYNIKITKAEYSQKEFNFNIPVDENHIPLIKEKFINDEWEKLFEHDWESHHTSSIVHSAVAGQYFNQDGYSCSLEIIGDRHNLVIFDSYGNNEKLYALFEYNPDNNYNFYEVHTISQEKLRDLFIHARNTATNKKTTSQDGALRIIMPPNFDI